MFYIVLIFFPEESSDCQPKAHEILFGRASANKPASMTWRYPEPRAITKIEVSPVPFQNSDQEASKNVSLFPKHAF